ncbi:MAG: hypothetical protein RIC87_15720, partial [Kiloniellales bacterium]
MKEKNYRVVFYKQLVTAQGVGLRECAQRRVLSLEKGVAARVWNMSQAMNGSRTPPQQSVA